MSDELNEVCEVNEMITCFLNLHGFSCKNFETRKIRATMWREIRTKVEKR